MKDNLNKWKYISFSWIRCYRYTNVQYSPNWFTDTTQSLSRSNMASLQKFTHTHTEAISFLYKRWLNKYTPNLLIVSISRWERNGKEEWRRTFQFLAITTNAVRTWFIYIFVGNQPQQNMKSEGYKWEDW